MNQLGTVPWEYVSLGPYAIERFDPVTHRIVGEIQHHAGFVQAMEAFWATHPAPGLRTCIDARGAMIVGQVLGREWESPMTEEVARYLQATVHPDVWPAFSFIPQVAQWIAEQECS